MSGLFDFRAFEDAVLYATYGMSREELLAFWRRSLQENA